MCLLQCCFKSKFACISCLLLLTTYIAKASVIETLNRTICSTIPTQACLSYVTLAVPKCLSPPSQMLPTFVHVTIVHPNCCLARFIIRTRLVSKLLSFYCSPIDLFGLSILTDLWSTGVVFTECLQGEPLFHGDNGLDHLVVIISKLGTPSQEELIAMNENYAKFHFPNLRRRPMEQLFSVDISSSSDAMKLLDGLFQYDPNRRLSAREAMDHPFFHELRNANLKWTSLDDKLCDLPSLVGINDMKR